MERDGKATSESGPSTKDVRRAEQISRMEKLLGDNRVDPKKRAKIEFTLVMTKNRLQPKKLQELVGEVESLPTNPRSKQARQWLDIWKPLLEEALAHAARIASFTTIRNFNR